MSLEIPGPDGSSIAIRTVVTAGGEDYTTAVKTLVMMLDVAGATASDIEGNPTYNEFMEVGFNCLMALGVSRDTLLQVSEDYLADLDNA